jgi:hypothetical protein
MSHSRAEGKVGSNTLIPPLHARQLPQGLVYAVVVAAVAAWSWDRWESAHSTAIAALAASAFMLVLELALSSVSPWVARTVFGLRGLRTFTPVGRASAALPADEAGAPVEITEQELDGLRQAYARMLGEVEQLVAVSRDARPAPSAEELGERGWDAVSEPKPATSANLDDAQAPRITHRPRLTGSNIVFAILSVAAVTLFIVFVVVLVTA